jgi:hypothetical protein
VWCNDGCSCLFLSLCGDTEKSSSPPGGCGDGWGPAVGPQRLLRTFSMPVALVCVEEGESGWENTLGVAKGVPPSTAHC